MIAFFPQLYPDELLYSAFARYFDKSGYGIYRAAAEDIFENSLVKPDILFVSRLRNGLVDILKKQKSWEQIITEHTMYPQYARFLPLERRERAFRSLLEMDGKHRQHLPMPKRAGHHLRYCPKCIEGDRKQFGEAYWHREHQIPGIIVCPKHGCYIENSDVSVLGKASPKLLSAEISTQRVKAIQCENPTELEIAEYVSILFRQKIIDAELPVGTFLHEKMTSSIYTSPRGAQRNITLLQDDIKQYYDCLSYNPFDEPSRLPKIFIGQRYDTLEIAMVGFFLDIPVEELARMKKPQTLYHELFDRRIKELHRKGLKYPDIAKAMNAPINVVKPVGEGLYGIYTKGEKNNRGGAKKRDWDKLDSELLPKVTEAAMSIYGDGSERPRRVTVSAIKKKLMLLDGQLENLPKCMEVISNFSESIEEYWAREMVFFYQKLQGEDKTITATSIVRMTNSKRRNLIKGIPYLKQYTDPKTAVAISGLIME